ncbi:MAG: hypothetical protein JOZ45_08085 [Acidobacteriaceae bacterium]|nr:hypothetical protein [Acidobacteriaceae bacterium]
MGFLYLSVISGIVTGAIAAFIAARSGKRWLPVFIITAIVAAVATFLIWGRNLSVHNVSNQ